jgi:hypothetical protein
MNMPGTPPRRKPMTRNSPVSAAIKIPVRNVFMKAISRDVM